MQSLASYKGGPRALKGPREPQCTRNCEHRYTRYQLHNGMMITGHYMSLAVLGESQPAACCLTASTRASLRAAVPARTGFKNTCVADYLVAVDDLCAPAGRRATGSQWGPAALRR